MINFPSRVCSSSFCAEVYLSFTILNAGISLCSEIHFDLTFMRVQEPTFARKDITLM